MKGLLLLVYEEHCHSLLVQIQENECDFKRALFVPYKGTVACVIEFAVYCTYFGRGEVPELCTDNHSLGLSQRL